MHSSPAEVTPNDYSIASWQADDVTGFGLWVAAPADKRPGVADDDGLVVRRGPLVTRRLFDDLNKDIWDDKSQVRRSSTRPIERCFVFIDVSDFSKLGSGLQMLVVLSLVRLAEDSALAVMAQPEAKLCIGDGYIYVFKGGVTGTAFAADIANRIEAAVAARSVPEFHFRIGVHEREVRCFYDPGRKDWNYIGEGINGAQRVLGAIGKDVDDVVFVSAEVRQQILSADSELLPHLDNKGRRPDKHGTYWRVYQLNHTGVKAAQALKETTLALQEAATKW